MDYIPVFRFNDRVRIMQTREMENRGLANIVGRIVAINDEAKTISIYDECIHYHNIPMHSVSKA